MIPQIILIVIELLAIGFTLGYFFSAKNNDGTPFVVTCMIVFYGDLFLWWGGWWSVFV